MLHLRTSRPFHNDEETTSANVVASLKCYAGFSARGKILFDRVEFIDAKDTYTITMLFKLTMEAGRSRRQVDPRRPPGDGLGHPGQAPLGSERVRRLRHGPRGVSGSDPPATPVLSSTGSSTRRFPTSSTAKTPSCRPAQQGHRDGVSTHLVDTILASPSERRDQPGCLLGRCPCALDS